MDAALGFVFWFICGHALAFGGGGNGFIGGGGFFLLQEADGKTPDYGFWFFQACFAATAATIVSGAMAERTRYSTYLIYSSFMCMLIYPAVAHWVWSPAGWLSSAAAAPFAGVGAVDFAGSGVVHMTGGCGALVGAAYIGPRQAFLHPLTGRPRRVLVLRGQAIVNSALGTLLLWLGWFGFNGGSTLGLSGGGLAQAQLAITNTAVASAFGCITSLALEASLSAEMDLSKPLNGILAALVSITAGCADVQPWAALLIGAMGAVVYRYCDAFITNKLLIDDPLSAAAIHLGCGVWGLLAVGLFSSSAGLLITGQAALLGVQALLALSIVAWVATLSLLALLAIDGLAGMRLTSTAELVEVYRDQGEAMFSNDELLSTEFRGMVDDCTSEMLSGLHSFMMVEHSDEQLDALLAVQMFASRCSRSASPRPLSSWRSLTTGILAEDELEDLVIARSIQQRYFTPDSDCFANVSSATLRAIKQNLEWAHAGGIPVDGAIFEGATRELSTMIRLGPFRRFLRVEMRRAKRMTKTWRSGVRSPLYKSLRRMLCGVRTVAAESVRFRMSGSWPPDLLRSEPARRMCMTSTAVILWRDCKASTLHSVRTGPPPEKTA
eukprot:PLAT4167.1.p1 GENE.PLAT4167.1~~PLAT4167.1.p1  ORF type:complete len:665 (+),score=310.72 PLAT4167.1:174-1997(+)